ncbi:MAG: hypothetical protein V9H69_12700 [Anaerolineae bacterium]
MGDVLSRWAERSPKPLVLLIDEVDALIGDTLIAVLRQLRAGYAKRPRLFPQSVVLCGVRDVRDYRIHSSRSQEIITGGSAFNIKARSLRMDDFDRAEVQSLYAQHTAETGQPFERRGAGADLGADPGPALAGQRAGLRALLRAGRRPRAQPPDHGRSGQRGQGAHHPAPRDASGSVGGQAARAARAPRDRADPGRPARARAPAGRRRAVRGRPGPGGERGPTAHRQPHLPGDHPARVDLHHATDHQPGAGLVHSARRPAGYPQAAGGLSAVLPRALGALAGRACPTARPARNC